MNEKTALITGASKGIGRKLAVSFAEAGYFVAVNYLSDKPQAEGDPVSDRKSRRQRTVDKR